MESGAYLAHFPFVQLRSSFTSPTATGQRFEEPLKGKRSRERGTLKERMAERRGGHLRMRKSAGAKPAEA